ncbi:MAG: SdiA-regulated domain-containing protein [Proteobacteria bacterium]|nr:SdiA-regulated domain-containing protein [Pseudomonadota bacterium]
MLTAWLAACSSSEQRSSGQTSAASSKAELGPADIVALEAPGANGLSGLTVDDAGTLWSLAERIRVLVSSTARPGTGGTGAAAREYQLTGVPDGRELESIAWLGKNRFAIGTEGTCDGKAYRILIVEVSGNAARVLDAIEMPYALWPQAPCNARRGLEALCHAGGQLVVAVEQPHQAEDGRRVALVGRVDLNSRAVVPYRVALTSDKGKISALHCDRARAASSSADAGASASSKGTAGAPSGTGGIVAMAIERHFSVARLIAFRVPESPSSGRAPPILPAEVVADVYPYTTGGKRNFEGLVRLGERRVGIIVDNHYAKVTGPNELLWLQLPAGQATETEPVKPVKH